MDHHPFNQPSRGMERAHGLLPVRWTPSLACHRQGHGRAMNVQPNIFRAKTQAIWICVGPGGADMRLKLDGLGSLARDLAPPTELARAAA